MSQTSVSPSGEPFALPEPSDYAKEFERIE